MRHCQKQNRNIQRPLAMNYFDDLFERYDGVVPAEKVDGSSGSEGLKEGPGSYIPVANDCSNKQSFADCGGHIRDIYLHNVFITHKHHFRVHENLIDICNGFVTELVIIRDACRVYPI